MRNHDEKIKDMSRSVLPSTWEGAGWTRRRIHKRHRARVRVALAARGGTDPGVRDTYRADIARLVLDRRFNDKDAPLVRWALATVAASQELREAPRAEQVAHFSRLLPPDLIGKHATRHIAMALDEKDRRERPGWPRGQEAQRAALTAQTERLAHEILTAGLHGTLNANLRALARRSELDGRRRPVPRRLLLGAHDVQAFALDMAVFPQARVVIAAVAAMAGRP